MTAQSPEAPLRLLKWLAIGFGAITLVITIVFFTWWIMKDRFIFGDDKFDTVRWMAVSKGQETCDRGDMVLDVKNRVLHRGMSRTDATVLLGRPAWEDAHQFEYELGVCLWVIHGLRLYFDDQGRLTHSLIVQH